MDETPKHAKKLTDPQVKLGMRQHISKNAGGLSDHILKKINGLPEMTANR